MTNRTSIETPQELARGQNVRSKAHVQTEAVIEDAVVVPAAVEEEAADVVDQAEAARDVAVALAVAAEAGTNYLLETPKITEE
jgi:hypothetical protein